MVTAFWGPAYPTGSGIYASELAERLVGRGHEVHIITSDVGNMQNNGFSKEINLHALHSYGFAWNMNPISSSFRKILSGRFDIVHVHSYIFFLSNTAAMARWFGDHKYLLHFHGGLNHQMHETSSDRRMWAKEKVFDRTLGRMTVDVADELLSVARSDLPIIRRKFGRDATHLPNAVSLSKFRPEKGNPVYLTYVGKFEEWKGFPDLLEIFSIVKKDVPEAKLLLVGQGSHGKNIPKDDPSIRTVGHVTHNDMTKIYHDSAVTVLPSYMEGSPTFCMESLSCGVPCVATDVGDTSEIVLDGRTGYLAKPGDIGTMAERIVDLMTDGEKRRRMGEAGRAHIVNNFNYETITDRVLDVYRSVLDRG